MKKSFVCVCGYVAGNDRYHTKKCETYKSEIIRVTNNIREYAKELYQENYSAKATTTIIIERENTILHPGPVRTILEKFLKEENVYEGVSGVNVQRHKQIKLQETMMVRYGVANYGQIDGQGFKKINNIPYHKVDALGTKYKEYREKVEKLTKRNISTIEKPDYCYYTGVKFTDVVSTKVNPNDPRKRSVDHKIPTILGFLRGMSVEEISDIDNLVFVLRSVNQIKSNTSHDEFIEIAKYLRNIFIAEGFEVNESS